jgi:hypothetical protein
MSTQTTIQETRLQPYQETMQKDIYASAKELLNQPRPTVDYESFIAERDPLLAQAEQLGQQGIGAYQGLLDDASAQTALAADYARQQAEMARQAGGQFDPSGIERFMNPYEQLVLDPALQRIRDQQLESENLARSQAIQSGAFGGSRAALQQQAAARDFERQRQETIGNLKYQGFQTASGMAQKAFEDEKRRQLGIAELLGQTGTQMGQTGVMYANLAEQGQQMGLQDVATLQQLGRDRMTYDQGLLDAQLRSEQERINEPYGRLGFISDIFAGQPTTPTTYTTSPVQQTGDRKSALLGTGIALLGAGRAFGNPFAYNG